jgi:hypothetical protein
MYRKLCSSALTLVALFTLANAAQAQNKIGWHYDGYNTPDDALLPADLAGAPGFEQLNWNNHVATSQGPSSPIPFPLVDNTGAATGMSLTAFTLSAPNSWYHNQTANPNQKLMDAFADQQPTITFSSIPASFTLSGYSIVVYYGNNEDQGTNSLLTITGSINDSFSRLINTGNTANASYGVKGWLQETGALTGKSNYTVFTGLNDPAVTISLPSSGGLNNNGISAVQFVAVPEPASFAMLALGAAALGFRRRRP